MPEKKLPSSRLWVGVLNSESETKIQELIDLYQKERADYNNAAVIVSSSLSFKTCAQLEDTFDFIVKLGQDQSPEQLNLLLWDHVTLRNAKKVKNGTIPKTHITNGNLEEQSITLINDQHKPSQIIKSNNNNPIPIAIVGLSCRLPGANDASTFWNNLVDGVTSLRVPPEGRWRSVQGCSNLSKEHSETKAGFLSCDVDTFDPGFWGISPLELSYTDPQARMMLQLGWEALENAGIPPSSLHGSNAGIFLGLWRDEYKDLLLQNGSRDGGEELRRYLGCSMGNAAARIAHALGTTGPALATETGCSSSICSIGAAMDALRQGKTNVALAGGANLLLKPFVYPDFQGVLSPSGCCKTFQEDADGFARAEGIIFYVLKRLDDAITNQDHVYAILKGYGSSQEGLSKSVGTPTILGEARAMTLALQDSGLSPSSVDWVELHGTGTKVGDPIEVASTRKAYELDVEPQKQQELNLYNRKFQNYSPRNLIITSVKAHVGHTESVSGATGLLRVILSMEHGLIPPQPFSAPLNPKLNLENITIPQKALPWKGKYAGVSSFGITGTNAHLIVERGQKSQTQPPNNSSLIPSYILPLSAKCPGALKELKLKHAVALEQLDDSEFGNYCYTAAISRTHFSIRSAVVASSKDEMIECLQNDSCFETEISNSENQNHETLAPILCFLFPGQGCQYTGMGRSLYSCCSVFRRHFDLVDDLLSLKYGIALKSLLFEGTAVSLYSQLCIFGVEYSLLKTFSTFGVVPNLVLGHSFGEFAASVAAGAISLPTALELLVATRTKLFARVEPGAMLVLKANEEETQKLIDEFLKENEFNDADWVDIAGVNSPEQTVVSAKPRTIANFATWTKTQGIKNTAVGVTHAFHSRALDKIGVQFEREAGQLSYSTRFPEITYVSSVEGRIMDKEDILDANYWRRHMRQRVEFVNAAKDAVGPGQARLFLEVGPHPLLSPLIRKNAPNSIQDQLLCIPSMRNSKGTVNELTTLLEAVASLYVHGIDLCWNKIWASLGNGKFSKIPRQLPLYPFQNKETFWFTPECQQINQRFETVEEMMGIMIHPLLGKKLATPLPATTIFITSTKNLLKLAGGWLQEHKLGPHVIFPAACYIEMSLSAVKSIRNNCLTLEQLEIKAALPLEFDAEIQTLLENDPQNCNNFKVSFFSKKSDSVSWKLHAVVKVTSAGSEENYVELCNTVTTDTGEFSNLYEKMEQLGYNFGPPFQTLKPLKRTTDGNLRCEIDPSYLEQSTEGYILHPTIIDAMIQSALLIDPLTGFKLPMSMASFKWYPSYTPSSSNSSLVVYATPTGSTLFQNSIAIASLSYLTTIATTLPKFQRASGLVEEIKVLPLWVEEWTQCESQDRNNHFMNIEQLQSSIKNNVVPFSLASNMATEFDKIEIYVCEGIVASLKSLGWCWRTGDVFEENEVSTKLGLKINPKFLQRLLHYAEKAGFLMQQGKKWEVIRNFDESAKNNSNKNGFLYLEAERQFAQFYLQKLPSILSGSDSVLPHLFPQNKIEKESDNFSAERLYSTFCQNNGLIANLSSVSSTLFQVLAKTQSSNSTHPLRILEVGGGTGSATCKLLTLLEESGTNYYTFTDISPTLLSRAEDKLSTLFPKVKLDFKIFNIENDAMSQDLLPRSYDIIIGLNVLHATVDLSAVCRNLRSLLQPGGFLLIAEQLRSTALVDIIFGHCEGYWRYNDGHRKDHCLLEKPGWEQVLNESGYGTTYTVESPDIGMGVIIAANQNHSFYNNNNNNNNDGEDKWMLICGDNSSFDKQLGKSVVYNGNEIGIKFDEMVTLGKTQLESTKQVIFVVPTETEDGGNEPQKMRPILESFLTLAQSYKNGRVVIVTQNVAPIVDESAVFDLGSPLLGMARSWANECPGIDLRWVDLDMNESETNRLDQVMVELKNVKPNQRFVSYRGGMRYTAKLVPTAENNTLLIPEGRIQLRLPESRSIADLEWESVNDDQNVLGPNEVQVRVLASGLNFKDLLNIMKPTEEFFSACGVGADFCGVIVGIGESVSKWLVGDSVLGMNPVAAPLPNYVTIDSNLVALLPESFTHSDGATLPTAFFTVYHCLVDVGKLRSGEWALIHTASGAVGLVAIQIAKVLGVNLVVTAGSRRKRAYLKNILGLTHVYNSRDHSSFTQGVIDVTNGVGVHLVLNSLTSKGWKEASLSVTRKGGRFVEMSKLNIWSKAQVAELRPDVSYFVEDLSAKDESRGRHLTQKLEEWLQLGKIKPIRHTTFGPDLITTALGQLERALHIGKIVISWNSTRFNERSSYLITGGCGALGLELAKWMLLSGAKHLVLVGRNTEGREKAILDELRQNNEGLDVSGVILKQVNISDKTQVFELLSSLSSDPTVPQIRGIFHLAGVLQDGIITSQSMSKFETVFQGKVDGAWALHEASTSLSLELEYFTLFSSAMWLIGGPGQSNYAAANAALSSLAEHRHRLGLAGNSIAWGHWGEVGMAAETSRHIFGMEPFSTERGIQSMEKILKHSGSGPRTIMAAELNTQDIKEGSEWLNGYIELQELEVFGKDINTVEQTVEEKVHSIVAKILRYRGVLDGKKELGAMGMDSLMFMELKNRLQAGLNVAVEIPDGVTVDSLVAMVSKAKQS